jgi:enoyl-CoA hydratase
LLTTGYATHLIASDGLSDLVNRMLSVDPNNLNIVVPQSVEPPSQLNELAQIIECFRGSSLIESMELLQGCIHPESEKLYQDMLAYSPLALHIIWRYMNKTRGLEYADVGRVDLSLAKAMFLNSDIFEGIRTRLIDKGDAPKWRYQSICGVSPKEVETFFV